jgi:probable F420-dependent oxidoreductase
MRFGIQLPHYGSAPDRIGVRRMAELIVERGFDGIWLSDHVVMVDDAKSTYPYTSDGSYTFDTGTPWYELVATLGYLAAVTEEIELGTAVCVLPQRQPVLLAKQLATVDRLAGGRLTLGVGSGWLAEEFAALGRPFDRRGERTVRYVELLRECWSGSPRAAAYDDLELPPGVRCEPTPPRGAIPVFLGGNSPEALRRVARVGDGWLGAAPLEGLDPDNLRKLVGTLREACDELGRDPAGVELAIRLAPHPAWFGSTELRDLVLEYAAEGIGCVTIDFGWRDEDSAAARLDALAETAQEVRTARSGVSRAT